MRQFAVYILPTLTLARQLHLSGTLPLLSLSSVSDFHVLLLVLYWIAFFVPARCSFRCHYQLPLVLFSSFSAPLHSLSPIPTRAHTSALP